MRRKDQRSIGKYVSQRASYSRVIMLKLGRIAFFYSLVFFMANIDAQTFYSYIFQKLHSLLFLEIGT